MTDAPTGHRVSSSFADLLGEVLQHVSEGVCVTDLAHRALFINGIFSRIFRTPPHGFDNTDVRPFLWDGDGEAPWLAGGARERWRGQARHRRVDGLPFVAAHESILIRDPAGEPCGWLHLVDDLTESKQSERATRESEERYRVILQSIVDAVLIVNEDGIVETINDAAATQDYIVPNRLNVGAHLHSVLPRRMAQQRLEALHEVLASRQPRHIEERSSEGEFSAFLSTTVNPLISADGTCTKVVMVSRDVTADKEREVFLRRFSRSILSAQEVERKRVAGELHDGLAQSLAALRVALRQIERDVPPDDERQRAQVEAAIDSVRALIEDTRRIAHKLTPTILEDIGLTAAIQRLLRTFADAGGQTAERQIIPLDGLFRPEEQIHIYRVLQEVFNNILRHAHASRVDLDMRRSGNTVEFEVRDNGVGFRVDRTLSSSARGGGHQGLRGLQERARLLSGTLSVRSAPGEGTTVVLGIPITGRAGPAGRP
jgi:PAS domain S-box-containing protein